ncbi:MAG: UvrD-helicase domain-containing protein [candidate division WOR-3 bacterium]|nr:MAG: UvrD-helicase domain-containing protein [candidate division WOR-3 bacterium]
MAIPIKNIALISAAGSGKTHALTKRFLMLYLHDSGFPLESLYAITFTNAAAFEMKNRILRYLDVLCAGSGMDESEKDVLDHFNRTFPDIKERARDRRMQLLSNLSDLHISTFHSLFASFLSCIPFAADIMPGYDILDESRENVLLVQAIDDFFEAAGRDKTILRVLSDMMEQRGRGLKSGIDGLYKNLINWMDFFDRLVRREQQIKDETSERSAAFADSLQKFVAFFNEHKDAAMTKTTGKMNNNLANLLAKIEGTLGNHDAAALEPFFGEFLDKGIESKKYIRDFMERLDEPERFHEIVSNVIASCQRYVEILSQREMLVHVKPILGIHEFFQRAKNRENALSFSDIEAYTLRALVKSPDTEYLYFKLGAEISHLLIDEFQDTSLHQIEILEPIMDEITAVDPGTKSLFYVGDPHQSIFRWRGGAPELFEYVKERYRGKIESDELVVNYRTKQEIVDFINTILDKKDQAKSGNGGGWVRIEEIGNFSVKGEGVEAVMQKTRSLIEELTDNYGYALDDIAVLTRKNEFAQDLAGVLSSSGIACVSHTRASILDEPDVQFMLHLLRFLDNPQDEFSLVHVLLSSVVDLKEETIRKLSFQSKTLFLVLNDHYPEWSITRKLKSLLSIVYVRNPYEVIYRGIQEFRLQMSYPLATLLDAALTHTWGGLNSLASFITWIEKQGTAFQVKESHARGVQILTIHRAKGLEFDVVIIPETDVNLSRGENDQLIFSYMDDSIRPDAVHWRAYGRYIEGLKEAERARMEKDLMHLLYVALTRAKSGVCMFGYTTRQKGPGFWFETIKGRLKGRPFPMDDIVPKERRHVEEERTKPYVEVREAPVARDERTLYSPTERTVEIITPERRRGMKYGEMIHRALSNVEWLDGVNIDECTAEAVEYMKDTFARSTDDEKEIESRLGPLFKKTISDPDLRFLFYRDGGDVVCKNELPIYFEEEKKDVSAQIDRLMIASEEIMIADYKTGAEKSVYVEQIKVYREGIEKIYPGRRIRTFLVYLEKPRGTKIVEV